MGFPFLERVSYRLGNSVLTRMEQVTYFKKWRVQEIQKQARLKELEAQGANKMDIQSDFSKR